MSEWASILWNGSWNGLLERLPEWLLEQLQEQLLERLPKRMLERLQIAPPCLVDEEVTLQEVAGLVCAVAALAERGAAQRRYHVHRVAGSMSTSTRSEVGARLPLV